MHKLVKATGAIGAFAVVGLTTISNLNSDKPTSEETDNNEAPTLASNTEKTISSNNAFQTVEAIPAQTIPIAPAEPTPTSDDESQDVTSTDVTQKSVCYDLRGRGMDRSNLEGCEDIRTFSSADSAQALEEDINFDVPLPLDSNLVKECFLSAMSINQLPAEYVTDADGKGRGEGMSINVELEDVPSYQQAPLDSFIAGFQDGIRTSFNQEYYEDTNSTIFALHVSTDIGQGFIGYKFVTIFNHSAVDAEQQIDAYGAQYIRDLSEEMPNYDEIMLATPEYDKILRSAATDIVDKFTACNFSDYDTSKVNSQLQIIKDYSYVPEVRF